MLSSAECAVSGTPTDFSFVGVPEPVAPESPTADRPAADSGDDSFRTLVALYQSNSYLLSELEALQTRRRRAVAYRDAVGANPTLAQARIDQLRARHSALLAMLRANRVAARRFLSRPAVEFSRNL